MNSPNAAAHVKEERYARVFDREIAPIWHDRFSRMIVRSLSHLPPPPSEGRFVLDVHAHTGRTTSELLHRLESGSRVLAIEAQAAQISLAKAKIRPEWKQRVYFKEGDFDDVTEMDDESYDLTVANLVLGEVVADWRAAIGELVRVTKPGGVVLASMPLYGTWTEVEDLFEEVLRDSGRRDAIATLNKLRRMRPRPKALADACEAVELDEQDYIIEHERFELLFRSGREFLFSPVIEHGPLRLWRAVLGDRPAQEQQQIFWRLKETIDAYFARRVLAATVVAGLIQIRVPGPGVKGDFASMHWSRYPSLDAVFRGGRPATSYPDQREAHANPMAGASDEDFELDLEFEVDDDDDADLDIELDAALGGESDAAGASELDLEIPVETAPDEDADDDARPKTAAQSLVDAKILDEDDLRAEAPDAGFDPSQPLGSGVPAPTDAIDTDELFNDKDTGSYIPVPGESVQPPDLDDDDADPDADADASATTDDELLGSFAGVDEILEDFEEIEEIEEVPASAPPPPKPTAAPKKKLRLPPLPKGKKSGDDA